MSEIGDGGSRETPAREGTGYLRVPLPVAALAAAVVLAVLLAVGLYANANLRTSGVILPTPATAVAAATLPPATLAPTAPPGGCHGDSQAAAVIATSPPTAAAVATNAATAGSTPLATVEGATPTAAAGAGAQSPTPLPTVEPTLAAEVSHAYERFGTCVRALLELDKSHLSQAMDGDIWRRTIRISRVTVENRPLQT